MDYLYRRPLVQNSSVRGKNIPVSLYFGAMASFAFDFRSEAAGAAMLQQSVFMAFFIIFSVSFVMISKHKFGSIFEFNAIAIPVLVFAFAGSFSGLLAGQPFYAILVNFIPSLIYLICTFLTIKAVRMTKGSRQLFDGLVLICGIYAVTKAIIFISGNGLDLSSVRYQVLGSSTIACLALLVMSIYLRTSFMEMAVSVTNLALILASVTRTMLILPLAQAAVYVFDWRSTLKNRRIYAGLPFAMSIIFVILAGDILLNTGLVDRWVTRLTVAQQLGDDVTKLTRIAEVRYMQEEWLASMQQTIFGNGIAAVTRLTGPEGALAAMIVGNNYDVNSIGFGHHQYWSVLYISGLFGAPLIAVYIWLAVKAALVLRRCDRVPSSEMYLVKLTCWGAMIILGTFAYGFFASFGGDRGFSLWLGIGTGLLIAGSRMLMPYRQNGRRLKTPNPPGFDANMEERIVQNAT